MDILRPAIPKKSRIANRMLAILSVEFPTDGYFTPCNPKEVANRRSNAGHSTGGVSDHLFGIPNLEAPTHLRHMRCNLYKFIKVALMVLIQLLGTGR